MAPTETFLVNTKGLVKEITAKAFEKFRTDTLNRLAPSKTPAKQEGITRAGLDDSSNTPSSALSASLFGRYGMAAPPTTPIESKKKRPLSDVAALSAGPASAGALKSEVSSPGSAGATPLGKFGTSVDNYVKRRGAGDVRVDFNGQLANVMVVGASASTKKVITVDEVEAIRPYRYMWNGLAHRAQTFRNRAERLGNELVGRHEQVLGDGEMGAFHLPRTEEVICFGVLRGEGSDLKLDARNILLEGQAPDNDNIYRIKLDLRALSSYALFPGQIVAVRGVNPTGQSLVVKQLVTDATQPVACTDTALVYEQGPVKVSVASGPFCTHDNLDYRPLSDLMDTVLSNGTDVLVLIGPFVDASHPAIEGGNIGRSYADLFHEIIGHHIVRRVEAHNSTVARGKLLQRVVLVPSLLDMHHHPVFPQFPFAADAFPSARDWLVCVGNPAQLRINGVTFGFTSIDPLKHVASSLLLQRPADPPPPSRMLEVASQLLQQQSFLPLNPPPLHINLDSSSDFAGLEFGQDSPQILVLPSALKEFVDPVHSTLVVNPSFLVRGGSGGGTFAEITLYPRGQEDAGDAQPMELGTEGYNLNERVGIKVIKI